MLYPYRYINHSMERMQEFIDYIFYRVWCEAPNCDYDIKLFDGNTDLKEIITDLHNTDPKGADFFVKGLQEIFNDFKGFSLAQIDTLKNWYAANNNIEELCKNNPAVLPVDYSDIFKFNQDFEKHLKIFFASLYSGSFLSLKTISDKIGKIEDHYNEFVRKNNIGKCLFCGLYDIDGEYVPTREAYDHYLPKSKYPFSSINFRNLAPICNKCNSGNKGTKDPLHDTKGVRRKSFYAYNPIPHTIDVSLVLNSNDIAKLTPQDITITFGPACLSEEIKTWNELFGIERRYKDKCCSADAKYWITQVFDEHGDNSPMEFLSIRLESAQKSPYNDINFLRKPFLEACAAQHVFD
jgi:hypothetical protein